MQEIYEMRVLSLDWEDLLEDGMATHSSILAWRIPWTKKPDGLWSIGSQEWDTTEHTHTQTHTPHTHLFDITNMLDFNSIMIF